MIETLKAVEEALCIVLALLMRSLFAQQIRIDRAPIREREMFEGIGRSSAFAIVDGEPHGATRWGNG